MKINEVIEYFDKNKPTEATGKAIVYLELYSKSQLTQLKNMCKNEINVIINNINGRINDYYYGNLISYLRMIRDNYIGVETQNNDDII